MTKLIAALIIIAVLYGGWELFLYWDKVKNEEQTAQKQANASRIVPEQLSGMPQALEASLQTAQREGASGLTNFLKNYGRAIQDPRKAWIELDYCLLLSRENPAEARQIFAAVKERTSTNSPVYPRIRQLEKTYE
jgi:hypothetical protein